jgi:DNA repair exonuclease SbcCD ATPase subunit
MRNFLSIGNSVQSINFNREELVLVLGENLDLGGEDAGSRNGVGKTALMNALSYALFSWSISDIKKEHLVNKSNGKNMLVTLDFESNSKNYRIVRGLKPRVLEFYENGKKFADKDAQLAIEADDSAQGDNRETQREIEKVIGMSHDMFCQIVAINTYTQPFLFQKIADQRNIIEQLLGITLLSEKAEQLKEEIKFARESLSKEEVRIKSVEAANKRIQSQIDSLVLRQKAWNKQKYQTLLLCGQRLINYRESILTEN